MIGLRGGPTGALGDLIASNSITVVETNCEDRASGSASNIAGTGLATAENYYVKVRQLEATSLARTLRPYHFYLRVFSESPIPENVEGAPEAPRSNGWGGRVIGPATAKNDIFAITVNRGHTIGVIVGVDLERGGPEWQVIAASGVFTGCFILTL
jgi:hypothetical protein